ncbi:MAG TPA: hypothetical protein VFT19_05460 [Solirubrobacterales bacterium]|nr:hypothetical protein [Solirubrobacterales bacterium]
MDRAYVLADPSTDKQELYVAVSRSREETYLYATPEIQAERAEYAPKPPNADAIGHIGDGAVRDRAQTAAHDEALRSELARMPTSDLMARQTKLDAPSRFEANAESAYQRQQEHVAERQHQLAEAVARCEAVEDLGWRARRQQLPGAQESERMFGERLGEEKARLSELAPPRTEIRREHEIVGQVLAEREGKMLLAARLAPPAYVVKELGERPADLTKAKAWDRGVRDIESYRNKRSVTDKDSALGPRPEDRFQRNFHDHARDRIRDAQRRLDRVQQAERSMQRSREMGRGHDFGIGR